MKRSCTEGFVLMVSDQFIIRMVLPIIARIFGAG